MITIDALMTTGVVTIHDDATVADAQSTMDVAGIRHLPVCDQRQHVVGIISDRDLKHAKPKDKRIGALMTREVITVRPEEPASRAAELMLENKLGSLPVVGPDETLIGIITETDFLQVARRALSGKSLRERGED